jgi:hypothetical protein
MTIFDRIRGKFRRVPSEASDQSNQSHTTRTDRVRNWLSYLTHAGFILFVGSMAFAVYQLGIYYTLPEVFCYLVATACAAGLLGHGSAVTRPTTNTSRTMHGLALGAWVLISIFLAALYMFVSSELLAAYLPDAMVTAGAIVYSLAFAIGLGTSTVALVVPAVAGNKIIDDELATLGAAVSKYGENVAILIAVAVSSFHILSFGQTVAKLDVFSVFAAMIMADIAFITAEKRVVTELKARHENGRYDRFDLLLWGVFSLFVITYLVMINVYAVRATAGTLDRSDPLFLRTLDFYGASPSILLLMIAALSILTALIDFPSGRTGTPQGAGIGLVGRFSHWLAQNAVDVRSGYSVVKDAVLHGELPAATTGRAALPPAGATSLGSEGNEMPEPAIAPKTDIKTSRGDTIEGEIGDDQPTPSELESYLHALADATSDDPAIRAAAEEILKRTAAKYGMDDLSDEESDEAKK